VDAISFLGLGKYEEAVYRWDKQECRTRFFAEAVCQFFRPERVYLFVTEGARRQEAFAALQGEMGPRLIPVPIPDGQSEQELWQIFEKVAEAVPVQPGSRLVFDITHGFRSLPFLTFLAMAYLGRAKGVVIERVVYGAFEARDQSQSPPLVPVFDLTPFLSLLDWLTAVEALQRRDDAQFLAELLEEAHDNPWRSSGGRGDPGEMPRFLDDAAGALRRLSAAMHLARPLEVMGAADRLRQALPRVRGEVARWAKPFSVLLKQVEGEYAPFAHDEPQRLDKEHLRCQLDLIRRYVDKKMVAEAILLAREWLVNVVLLHSGPESWLDRDCRLEIEEALNQETSLRIRHRSSDHRRLTPEEVLNQETSLQNSPLDNVPCADAIVGEWQFVGDLRNDIAHCGFREQPRSLNSIVRDVASLPERLGRLLPGERTEEGVG